MSEKLLSQEQCFPQHEVAMIDDFNQTLRRIGINMNEDDQGADNFLYHTLGAAFNNAMSPGAVTDATKRVFLAEIAGASQRQSDGQSAVEALLGDPTFSDSDRHLINVMFSSIQYNRYSDMNIEEQTGILARDITSTLDSLGKIETTGQDKSVIRTTILAFGAGATLQAPYLQLAEQLMQDIHGQVEQ